MAQLVLFRSAEDLEAERVAVLAAALRRAQRRVRRQIARLKEGRRHDLLDAVAAGKCTLHDACAEMDGIVTAVSDIERREGVLCTNAAYVLYRLRRISLEEPGIGRKCLANRLNLDPYEVEKHLFSLKQLGLAEFEYNEGMKRSIWRAVDIVEDEQ